MRGAYFEKSALPSRIGARIGVECAGVLEAIGEGVIQDMVGKRVGDTEWILAEPLRVLGEEAVVPAVAIAEYAESLSPKRGAAVFVTYLTAWSALVHFAKITSDDFVASRLVAGVPVMVRTV